MPSIIEYSQFNGLAIVLVAMLFVFFLRDVQLLAAAPRGGLLARLAVYGAFNAIYLMLLTAILPSTGVYSPFQLIHVSPFWLVSTVWHCLIWLFCLCLNRSGRSNLCWLAALLPTPVLQFSMATGTLLLSHSTGSIGTVTLALIVALCWSTAVAFAVSRIQAVSTTGLEARFAIDFAGMANTTALILVPMSELFPGF
jgi:hypothetical protein